MKEVKSFAFAVLLFMSAFMEVNAAVCPKPKNAKESWDFVNRRLDKTDHEYEFINGRDNAVGFSKENTQKRSKKLEFVTKDVDPSWNSDEKMKGQSTCCYRFTPLKGSVLTRNKKCGTKDRKCFCVKEAF